MTDVHPQTERETPRSATAAELSDVQRTRSGLRDPLTDPLTDPLLQNQTVMFYGGGPDPAPEEEPRGKLAPVGERPILVHAPDSPMANRRGNVKIDAAIISKAADMVAGLGSRRPMVQPLFRPVIESLEGKSSLTQQEMERQIYRGKADLLNKGIKGLLDPMVAGTPAAQQRMGRTQGRLVAVEGQIKDVRSLATRADMAVGVAHAAAVNYQSLVNYLRGLDPGTGEFGVLVDAVEVAGKSGIARVGAGGSVEIARPAEGPTTRHEVNPEEMDAIMGDVEETLAGNDTSYPTVELPQDPLPNCLDRIDVAMDSVMNKHGALMGDIGKARSSAILAKSRAEKDELDKHNANVAAISRAFDEATAIATTIRGVGTKIGAVGAIGQKNPQLEELAGTGATAGVREDSGRYRSRKGGRFMARADAEKRGPDLLSIRTGEKLHVRLLEQATRSADMGVAGKMIKGMLDMANTNLGKLEATVGSAKAAAEAAGAGTEIRLAEARIGEFRTAVAALRVEIEAMAGRITEFRRDCLKQGEEMDRWRQDQARARDGAPAGAAGGAASARPIETENMRWKMLAMARVSESVQLLERASGNLQEVSAALRGAGLPQEEQAGLEVIARDLLDASAGEMRKLSSPLRAVAGRFQEVTRTAGGADPAQGK